MMVIFVSQCEKNALKKTRRVLDSFANRIGDRTWQTLITNEGLIAVKKLLRKTASKNTAVSCHWIRSRNRSDLVWIVGNRSKFNNKGETPISITNQDIINTQWENDWKYLPLIKSLTAVAGLFHDFGKSSKCFQDKLKPANSKKFIGDPLRHEYISCLLLKMIVNSGNTSTDNSWLSLLGGDKLDIEQFSTIEINQNNSLFDNLPPVAKIISWLILSHHRLPLFYKAKKWRGVEKSSIDEVFKSINQEWGYENKFNEKNYELKLNDCFIFPNGLPWKSNRWRKEIKRWSNKLISHLDLLEDAVNDGTIRIVLYFSRLSIMLGDHHFSSQPKNAIFQSDCKLFANTDRKTGEYKQKLDEHLLGVTKNAVKTAHLLPLFENSSPVAKDIRTLKKKSPKKYKWQDKAVSEIKTWRQNKNPNNEKTGFFCVNMASTGKGKTFANAKIMRAISKDGESLRYILALGLRTLTLQTGDEYRERIGLNETELAVLIGSKSVLDLHEENKKEQSESIETSESIKSLLDEEIDFECNIPEEGLTTLLTSEKDKKFLYAPVLSCTIDHIMSATESKRGGRHILPGLRLISSDLVIDEIDDFMGNDLIAIGRLIHLAGMLGRKVIISSATIPPDLAEGYFNSYREGWECYRKSRDAKSTIGCCWVDEFSTRVESIVKTNNENEQTIFSTHHNSFIHSRVNKLSQQNIKRKGEIISCADILDKTTEQNNYSNSPEENITIENKYFEKIKQNIIEQHKAHNSIDFQSQKHVSFGCVRVANISPCIKLSEFLMDTDWPPEFDPKIMAYHSRQVLLLRSEQEKHLNEVLKRKEIQGEVPAPFKNSIIRNHIKNSNAKNIIFVLVATPVEEVGRDHDFDWAILEPSSFRSIIQLAGRVMRHRDEEVTSANIAIMQHNLKSLNSGSNKAVFCRPGYENDDNILSSHDLNDIIKPKFIDRVDSTPRIKKEAEIEPKKYLDHLEHHVISNLLTNYKEKGPQNLQGWLTGCWWLTALPQKLTPFRQSEPTIKLFLTYQDGECVFKERDNKGELIKIEITYGITHESNKYEDNKRLWLPRDYVSILEEREEKYHESMYYSSVRYGEITIPDREKQQINYIYSDNFGLKEKEEEYLN